VHGPTTEIYAHGRVETRDAMREKAERGDVAGGQNYGYDNRRLGAHVERVVVPGHADVVQRIFRSVAAGHGFCRIAKGLNAFAIPSPTGRGWAISRVRERVMRELYRGRQVYGKTRWERRRGTKRKVDMPESEWIVREFSAQRIVDESLWEEAHRHPGQDPAGARCHPMSPRANAGRRARDTVSPARRTDVGSRSSPGTPRRVAQAAPADPPGGAPTAPHRLRLMPKITEGGRWCEFSRKASYETLLEGSEYGAPGRKPSLLSGLQTVGESGIG
jgi:hypothetical protein